MTRLSTIPGQMALSTTSMANDVGGNVALLGAFEPAMTFHAAILADLILIISQSTVERSKLSELVALVVVLGLWRRSSGLDDLIDQADTSLDFSVLIGRNDTVHLFLFAVILIAFALLDTSLASNGNLCSTLLFHLFETITARTDKQSKEVDFREFAQREINLFHWLAVPLASMIFCWGLVVRVELELSIHQLDALVFKLFAVSNLASVGSPALSIVSRRWRRAAFAIRGDDIARAKLLGDFVQSNREGVAVKICNIDCTCDGCRYPRSWCSISPTGFAFSRSWT